MASSRARFWPYAKGASRQARTVGETNPVEQLHRAVPEDGHALDGAPELHAHAGRAGQGQLEVLPQRHLVEEAAIWKERAIPSGAICSGSLPVMSLPSNTIEPDDGDRKPVRRLNSVVLPAPLGPTSAWMVPSVTERLTSETALNPRNSLVRERVSSSGASWTPAPPRAVAGLPRAVGGLVCT